jgi:hypothetical protein
MRFIDASVRTSRCFSMDCLGVAQTAHLGQFPTQKNPPRRIARITLHRSPIPSDSCLAFALLGVKVTQVRVNVREPLLRAFPQQALKNKPSFPIPGKHNQGDPVANSRTVVFRIIRQKVALQQQGMTWLRMRDL